MSLHTDHFESPSSDFDAGSFDNTSTSNSDRGVANSNRISPVTSPAPGVSQSMVIPMSSSATGNPSPELPPSRGTYEIKFLIDDVQGQFIRDWARTHLQPDPHSSPEFGCGYSVNSLYLDTPEFDVYHRGQGFRQRKYRLRRYGSEAAVWMEVKRKHEGRVRKRRTLVPDAEVLARLNFSVDEAWEGRWFQKRLQVLQLRPVCQVTYQRFACVGTSSNGPIRLTIDSDLNSQPAHGWNVPNAPLQSGQLLRNHQILELKFRESIPAAFRVLIEDLRLVTASFSKYRQSVEACIPMQQLMGSSTPDQIAG